MIITREEKNMTKKKKKKGKKKNKKQKKKSAHGDYGQIPTGDGVENPIGGN